MKIRTSVQVALIVGACTVLAPLYGPSIRARAATPQDDLDKSFKSIATVLSLLEQNYADTVSSEKAISRPIPSPIRRDCRLFNFIAHLRRCFARAVIGNWGANRALKIGEARFQ